jgi:hypothetical protein
MSTRVYGCTSTTVEETEERESKEERITNPKKQKEGNKPQSKAQTKRRGESLARDPRLTEKRKAQCCVLACRLPME